MQVELEMNIMKVKMTNIYTGEFMMTIDGVPAYEFFGPANGGPETICHLYLHNIHF